MGKAISPRPVSAAASSECLSGLSPKSLKISRLAEDDQLFQMYEKLKSVVPAVSGKRVEDLSTLEIVQNAIYYIYDLRVTISEADGDAYQAASGTFGAKHQDLSPVC